VTDALYAVAGNPVLPSMSPALFRAALAGMPTGGAYVRLAARSACEALRFAMQAPLAGMNVTAPFKEEMAALVQAGDEAVRTTGAVNVVVNRDGALEGYNTDCVGVVGALTAQGCNPAGKRALVFGAGGAAKAAAYALKSAGASSVVMLNRTLSRAQAAAARLGCSAAPLGELSRRLEEADILVSCVPRALSALPGLSLSSRLVVLDADYHGSSLELFARESGCWVVSGRDWLLHQAVGTHLLFAGTSAPLQSLADALAPSVPRPWHKRNVALLGFMGAGKTAVGPLVAARLGFGFVDSDQEIQKSAGVDVHAIFEQRGEQGFREIESAVVRRLESAVQTVFSLGGGAFTTADNFERTCRNAMVVWLWADADTCWARAADGTRPLLGSSEQAHALMSARTAAYGRAADLVIDTTSAAPGEIANRIVDEIRNAQRA